MNKKLLILLIAVGVLSSMFLIFNGVISLTPSKSATSDGLDEPEESDQEFLSEYDRVLDELKDWKRPDGPVKVALQAGHWKVSEAPEELKRLKERTGTSGGGKAEWQVNLEIAEKTKTLLEQTGYIVEILPATIPPDYWADVFVSIHADGNVNSAVSGYKSAPPRRDITGQAERLADTLNQEYEKATGLNFDPNITRNMRGYYAFNWRRYEHSLHPMTPAAIIETGFLTNAGDRRIIVNDQEKSAQGIANGIEKFLKEN
jgi:hypothetical protein